MTRKEACPQPWQVWWAELQIRESPRNERVLILGKPRPGGDIEILRISGERIQDPQPASTRAFRNTALRPGETEPEEPGETHYIDGRKIYYAGIEQFISHCFTITPAERRNVLNRMQKKAKKRDLDAQGCYQSLKDHIGHTRPPGTGNTPAQGAEERPKKTGRPVRRKTREQWLREHRNRKKDS